jgi:trimethylamine corrinoid protein
VSPESLIRALLSIDRLAAGQLLEAAIRESSMDEVVRAMVVPALEQIGDDWVQGRVSLSDVYMSSRICEELMKSLAPEAAPLRRDQPRIAIAALQDYHLLGKKMVQLALRSSGYAVIDFGQGIKVADLVRRVGESDVEVLLISTLMLPSALKVKDLRSELDRAGLKPKLIVGGAPFRFDRQLWKEVGADAMGVSAADALKILAQIIEERAHATPHATRRDHELSGTGPHGHQPSRA